MLVHSTYDKKHVVPGAGLGFVCNTYDEQPAFASRKALLQHSGSTMACERPRGSTRRPMADARFVGSASTLVFGFFGIWLTAGSFDTLQFWRRRRR